MRDLFNDEWTLSVRLWSGSQLLGMLERLTSNSLLPIYNAQNGIFDSIVSYGL